MVLLEPSDAVRLHVEATSVSADDLMQIRWRSESEGTTPMIRFQRIYAVTIGGVTTVVVTIVTGNR
jgi:hypothetical protein